MKQESPEHDLIDTWLSGKADRAARKNLARELSGNPGAVTALVNQACTEGALRARFAPALKAVAAYPARKTTRSRWLAAAGVAGAAAAIAIIIIMAESRSSLASSSKNAVSRLQAMPVPAAAVIGAKGSTAVPLEPHENLEVFLNRYWLNGKRRSLMKLSDATAELSRSIQQANTRKRPELAALSIEVQRPPAMEDPDVFFTNKHVSAGAVLRSLAAQAGAKLSYQSGKVVLTLLPPSPPVKERMAVRTYRLSEDWLTVLSGVDPETTEVTATGLRPKIGAGEILARFARLQRGEGSKMTYDAQTGAMTTLLTPSDHDRVRTSLEALNVGGGGTMVRIECKLVELPSNMEVKEQILSQQDARALSNGFHSTPGVTLMSMPSVITRNGTACSISSVKEVEIPDGAGGVLNDFSGWKIDLTAELQGEGLVANGTADVGTLKGNGMVQHGLLDITATMAAGEAALVRLPEESPGKQFIGMFSFATVDYEESPRPEPPIPDEPPPADPFAEDSPAKQ